MSAPSDLETREDPVISAPRTFGTGSFKMTGTGEPLNWVTRTETYISRFLRRYHLQERSQKVYGTRCLKCVPYASHRYEHTL